MPRVYYLVESLGCLGSKYPSDSEPLQRRPQNKALDYGPTTPYQDSVRARDSGKKGTVFFLVGKISALGRTYKVRPKCHQPMIRYQPVSIHRGAAPCRWCTVGTNEARRAMVLGDDGKKGGGESHSG